MELDNPFSFQLLPPIQNLHPIELSGRLLSVYDAQRFLRKVKEALQDVRPLFLLLKLEKLEYINSEGLNVLLKLLTMSRNTGGETWIQGSNDTLQQLFILTKIHHIFGTVSGEKEALEEIQNLTGSKLEK